MKILALDTTRKVSTVSLWDTETDSYTTKSYEERNNEGLLPMISGLLEESGYALTAIDRLGVCIGPGSFTGLRIGVTTMKSFAQMLGIPVFGIGLFEAMKEAAKEEGTPLLDARGGRVYYDDQGQAKIAQFSDLNLEKPILFSNDPYTETMKEAIVLDDSPLSEIIAQRTVQKEGDGDWRSVFPEYVGVSQAERNRKKDA